LSTRKELFIALLGHDGTEYGRAAVGTLVPDQGDLVNAETIRFPPMTHEHGVVTGFLVGPTNGPPLFSGELTFTRGIREISVNSRGLEVELCPYALRIEAGLLHGWVEPTPIQKLERDGKVGVAISNDYGGSWSTSWFDEGREHLRETVCMRADIVQSVLDGDRDGARKLAAEACGGEFDGDPTHLVVVWIPKGSVFEVDDYDGVESIHIIGSREYMTA
jgi:hypothetical protein